jgi:hypothetical protein
MPEEAQDKQQVKIKGVDIKKAEIQDFEVPSFVNYAYVWHYGGDLYIDLGLLTVEQMAAFKPGQGAEVKVAMRDRYVMSPITFEDLYKRMNLVREDLKSKGLLREENTEAVRTPEPAHE